MKHHRRVLMFAAVVLLFLPAVAHAVDADGDGYESVASGGTDCNDIDPTVNETAVEECNGRDDNCDGTVDEGFDGDGDGYSICHGDCDDADADRNPAAQEVCDGVDNDCDGQEDEGLDGDGDGYLTCGDPADCNDADPEVNAWAEEVCNGRDDNCDGTVDEDLDCGYADAALPYDPAVEGGKDVGGGCGCSADGASANGALGVLLGLVLLSLRRR